MRGGAHGSDMSLTSLYSDSGGRQVFFLVVQESSGGGEATLGFRLERLAGRGAISVDRVPLMRCSRGGRGNLAAAARVGRYAQ